MKPTEHVDRDLILPYAAAAWAAAVVLAITVAIHRWGPDPTEPSMGLVFRLAGGWTALLTAILAWMLVSEPIRLQRKVDEATDQLQRTKEEFRRLYDQAPLAYLTLDGHRQITKANERVREVLGYEPGELEGQPVLQLFRPGPEGREEAERLLDRFRSAGPVRGEELAMETAGGETLWVNFSVRELGEEDPESGVRVLSMILDITERKRAEEQLEYYAGELERSNEDLKQFAYVISHDLKEPLRVIKNYLQLLERRYGEELPEDATDFIDFSLESADRMSALIDSLLTYSRVGTQAEPSKPVDLEEVLEEVLADLAMQIQETGAEIEHEGLPTVHADPDQIRQLLQNLVSNAIKYNEEETPQIWIEAERVSEGWRIAVADDGPGIPEAQRDQVFDVFHRVGERLDVDGTGMGLAIARRIVERHGGRIWVEESEAGGARFAFTLPGQAASEDPAAQPRTPHRSATGSGDRSSAPPGDRRP